MALAGQNDHLVGMHSDVADVFTFIYNLITGLNCGDKLQVCIKEDHGIASLVGAADDSIPSRSAESADALHKLDS